MEDKLSGDEKRHSKRVRVSLSVVYRVNEPLTVRFLTGDREIKATILDLSEDGIAVSTDYDIPPTTVMAMRFTLFKIDKEDVSFYGPMEITGEVRYGFRKDGECRLGIKFVKIEEDDKREIANFINMARDLMDKEQKT